jgi:hypothetical protein
VHAACTRAREKSPRGNTPLGDEFTLHRDYVGVHEKRVVHWQVKESRQDQLRQVEEGHEEGGQGGRKGNRKGH